MQHKKLKIASINGVILAINIKYNSYFKSYDKFLGFRGLNI